MDWRDEIDLTINEKYYGTRSPSECEQWGMWHGCPGCPVLERGDCDNPDSQQYRENNETNIL